MSFHRLACCRLSANRVAEAGCSTLQQTPTRCIDLHRPHWRLWHEPTHSPQLRGS